MKRDGVKRYAAVRLALQEGPQSPPKEFKTKDITPAMRNESQAYMNVSRELYLREIAAELRRLADYADNVVDTERQPADEHEVQLLVRAKRRLGMVRYYLMMNERG